MEKELFEYTCNYYDEYKNIEIKSCGVVFATSFKEAASNIELYYGNLIDVFIQGPVEDSIYDFKDHPRISDLFISVKEKNDGA